MRPASTLEAIFDNTLHDWNVHFGVVGSDNDVSVFESSFLGLEIASVRYCVSVDSSMKWAIRNMVNLLANKNCLKTMFFVHGTIHPSNYLDLCYIAWNERGHKTLCGVLDLYNVSFISTQCRTRFWNSGNMCNIKYFGVITHNFVVRENRAFTPYTFWKSEYLRVGEGGNRCFNLKFVSGFV